MKNILFVIFLFIYQEPTYVEGKKFSGYIFPADHAIFMNIGNNERYTPSKIDIMLAERLLSNKLRSVNTGKSNQLEECPVIHKELKNYKRQYVGFINEKGEKVVWINFIWKDKVTEERLKEDIIHVKDGCSYFWTIKANLFTLTLHDLQVNGRG